MTFFKTIIFFIMFQLVTSCVYDNLEDLNVKSSAIGNCSINVRKNSPFVKKVFVEDFIPVASDPCYSDINKLVCRVRLDWGAGSRNDCPSSVDKNKFKDLNKCTWGLYTGYNFWYNNGNKISTYDADAVEIKDGYLILKILKNPNYDPKKDNCGVLDTKNPNSLQYYGTHCPIHVGGIDSKYFDAATPGFNMRFGRFEIKGKVVKKSTTSQMYAAAWLWPDGNKEVGFPYKPTSERFKFNSSTNRYENFGEIDLLEYDAPISTGWSSYVNYIENQQSAFTGQSNIYKMEEEHVFGLEWTKNKLSWYVDDCQVAELNEGALAKSGLVGTPHQITDIATFMILYSNLGRGFNKNFLGDIDSEFHIDSVIIYE